MDGREEGSARRWVGVLLAVCTPGLFAASVAPLEAQGIASIRITTSTQAVSACTSFGEAALSGEDGIALLREEAARRGADTVRLISFSGRDIRGELYRCASVGPNTGPAGRPAAPEPATPTRVPTTVVPAVSSVGSSPSPLPPPSPKPLPSATPAPRRTPGAPTSLEDRRRAAAERQKRAQDELEDLKALVRVTSDPALLTGCEKRGEGRASLENGEDGLRGDAVGLAANVVLVRRTDTELRGEYFRCPAAQLQAIPREHAAPAH